MPKSTRTRGKVRNHSSLKQHVETRLVSSLRAHPRQHEFFGAPTAEAVTALAADIESRGLQHAIEILPNGVIIAGHTRWLAFKQLGWTEIECVVRSDLAAQGEDAVVRYLVNDNVVRRQLSKLQQARLTLVLEGYTMERIAADGLSASERDRVGALLGMTGRNLSRWINVLGLPVVVQDAVDAKMITLQQAREIASRPRDEQQAIAKAVGRGKPLANIRPSPAPRQQPETMVYTARFRRLLDLLDSGIDQFAGNAHRINRAAIRKRRSTIDAAIHFLRELKRVGSEVP